MALAGREERAGQAQRPWQPFMLRLKRKSTAKLRLSERTRALMQLVPHNAARRGKNAGCIVARAANPYNAARARRVSAVGLAPTSGEIVTQIQLSGSRTDSLVRILHAQPRSRSARAPLRPVIRPISPIVVWGPRLRTRTMRPSSVLTYPDTTPKLRLVRVDPLPELFA